MGIPTYFRQITDKYPNIIIELEQNTISSTEVKPTHLFLDFNGIIHPCVQTVLKTYENKENVPKNKLEDLFLQEIKRYLIHIFDMMSPQKLLYIAIDGVAPRAKMIQQRKRRFRSIMEKEEIKCIKQQMNIKNNNQWDKNAITPGTQFMKKLSDFLKQLVSTHISFKNVNVIISDASVPGEGEHKILQYLKHKRDEFDKTDNFIIYGLDADLIMLSMASKLENIYLLREAVHFGKVDTSSLLYLNINKLKEHLFDELSHNISINTKLDKEMIINDYIFMCFLIGNDFIPKLPSLNIKNNAIELLLSLYASVLNERMEYLIYSGDINPGFLKDFLNKISTLEDEFVKEDRKKYEKKRYFEKDCGDEYEKKLKRLKFMPIINKEKEYIVAGTEFWRERYYYKLFNLQKYSNSKNIEEICMNYIEGIYWTTKYYFEKCESWGWCYKYLHAPCCKDLVEYFDICFDKLSLCEDGPVTPFIQLMNVLPPQSSHLLPKEYSCLMNEKNSPIIYYYPISIKLDKYHHTFYHECEPKLPNINMKLLQQIVDKIKKKYEINKIGVIWNKNSSPYVSSDSLEIPVN